MKILFLDDDEQRHECAIKALIGHDVTHVRTANEAVTALGKGEWDLAMLDHDLGGEHYAPSDANSGYGVVCAIEGGEVPPPKRVVVHSYNAAGAQRMVAALHHAGVPVCWSPFGPGAFGMAVGA